MESVSTTQPPTIGDPTPGTTAAIIVGASAWPHLNVEGNDAYANSAAELESYLTIRLRLPRRNLLRLFDSELDATETLMEIRNFIVARREAQVTDLLFCYIGHGDFIEHNEFFMPIRKTMQGGLEQPTSLVGKTLAATLKEYGRFLRQFMMLDCCYAAAAAALFKNSAGVTVLCSSGAAAASTLLADGSQTMFSAAVMGALGSGRAGGPKRLSFLDVRDLAAEIIRERWPDTPILPELHSPSVRGEYLDRIPFFPNPGLPAPGFRVTADRSGRTEVRTSSNTVSVDVAPDKAQRTIGAALEPLLQATLAKAAALSSEGLSTFAIRVRSDKLGASDEGAGSLGVEVSVLILDRDELLRATDLLLRLEDESETFGMSEFIKANLQGALMTGDQVSVAGLSLGARFEQIIRNTSPKVVPVRRAVQGEWPAVRLDLALMMPTLGVVTPVPVRIEIRSSLDDILSELHREIRTALTQDRIGQSERLLRQAEIHIGVLQKMLDGCAAYVDAIRRDVKEGIRGGLAPGQPLTSMSEPEQLRTFLTTASVPHYLSDELLAILGKTRNYSDRPNEAEQAELLDDAGALRRLVERESQPGGYLVDDGPGQRAYKYIARMDEALLRARTNNPEHLNSAIEIYKELEILFPINPTVRFRLGWTLGKLLRRPEALGYYQAANRLIEDALALNQFDREQRAPMHEITYMRERLPRLIGYQYWAMSQDCAIRNDRAGQATNLIQAYRTTQTGLGRLGDSRTTHNNLLYYAVQYLQLTQEEEAAGLRAALPNEITADDVTQHLTYLEPTTNLEAEMDETFPDTLRFAYSFLGRHADAARAARRVMAILLDPKHAVRALDERGRRLLSAAHQTIVQYDGQL